MTPTHLDPQVSKSRLSSNAEDYLKQIYLLGNTERVGTQDLADAMNVSPPSATGMLRKLHDLGLVDHVAYQGSTLTAQGTQVALEVLRHHRLIETFLHRALGYTLDELHVEAEALEHVISERLEERIAAYLGHPELDPHGDPIPTPEFHLPVANGVPLTNLASGQLVRLTRIPDAPTVTRKLVELGLTPGTLIRIGKHDLELGVSSVCLNNTEVTVSLVLAAQLFAQAEPEVSV